MHLGEISFCDKVGFNIKSDDTKKIVLQKIDDLCSFKVIQRHYDKYNDNSLSILNRNPHLVSVRTNGNPYLLFLTKHNFVNQCIFVDKKIQQGYFYPRMIIGKFWFDDSLYEDTVFDGEMVKANDGSWIYIINDIIVLNGEILSSLNLIKRVNKLSELLETKYVPDALSTCSIIIKRYFTYDELEQMNTDFIPKLPYSVRGLYFKPLYLKFKEILYNFNDSLIQKVDRSKLKKSHDTYLLKDKLATSSLEPEKHVPAEVKLVLPESDQEEKVFYARKTNQPDIFELHTTMDSSSFDTACINSISVSRMMKELMKDCNPNDKLKVVCKMHPKFKKWVPIRGTP